MGLICLGRHNKERACTQRHKLRQQCHYTHCQAHTMHNSQEFSSAVCATRALHYEEAERHRPDITPDVRAAYDGHQFIGGRICHLSICNFYVVYYIPWARNVRLLLYIMYLYCALQ